MSHAKPTKSSEAKRREAVPSSAIRPMIPAGSGGASFNRYAAQSSARRVVPRPVNASLPGAHGVSAAQLRIGRMNLQRADYGVASSEHERIHVRRSPGQTPTQFVDFNRHVRTAIATLGSRPVGNGMLAQLSTGNNPDLDLARGELIETNVHIRASANNHIQYRHPGGHPPHSPAYRRNQTQRGGNVTADVFWNPSLHSVDGSRRPSFIGLGHELVHAWRGRMGTAIERPVLNRRLPSFSYYTMFRDEFETVGLMPTPRLPNAPSENHLRAEHGLVPRPAYSGRRPGVLTALAGSLQTIPSPTLRTKVLNTLANVVG